MSDERAEGFGSAPRSRRLRRWLWAGLLLALTSRVAISPIAWQCVAALAVQVTSGASRRGWLEVMDSDHPLAREVLVAAALSPGDDSGWAAREIARQEVRLTVTELDALLELGEVAVKVARSALARLTEAQRWELIEQHPANADPLRRELALAALAGAEDKGRAAEHLRARLAAEPSVELRLVSALALLRVAGWAAYGEVCAAGLELDHAGRVVIVGQVALRLETHGALSPSLVELCAATFSGVRTGGWIFDLNGRAAWTILLQLEADELRRVAEAAPDAALRGLGVALVWDDPGALGRPLAPRLEALTPLIDVRGSDLDRALWGIARLRQRIGRGADHEALRRLVAESRVDAYVLRLVVQAALEDEELMSRAELGAAFQRRLRDPERAEDVAENRASVERLFKALPGNRE